VSRSTRRHLAKYDAICTVFASAVALERNELASRTFVERGFHIVGHGYRWVQHLGMSEDQERASIQQAVASIQRTTGQRILGWYTRPLTTLNTRRLLAEEGFLFDSDSMADDLPYYERVNNRPHLVVPYALDVNDIRFWKGTLFTASEWFEYARDCFETLYREGGEAPRMMSVGLDCRVIGRPGRIVALERFLEHVRGHPDVWICQRTDLARYWLEHCPPNGDGVHA
jgi:peptidoglycan/xylan/chitin deacetylase (PgdA/CDA1 family)